MSHSNAKTDEIARLWAMNRNIGSVIEKRGKAIRELEEKIEDRDAFIAALGILVDALKSRIAELEAGSVVEVPRQRMNLSDTRRSETFTLRIGSKPEGVSATLSLGYDESGKLVEAFIRGDRSMRGAVGAFADAWACVFSYALQHGLSAEWMLGKVRFLADGTGGVPFVQDEDGRMRVHPVLHHVSSLLDYVAAVIERRLQGKPGTRMSQEEAARKAEAA